MHLPGPRNSPVYIQSLPEHCLRLKKIKSFLLNKGAFKKIHNIQSLLLAKNPLRGASPKQKKKKREKNKKKKVKKKKGKKIEKDLKIKKKN